MSDKLKFPKSVNLSSAAYIFFLESLCFIPLTMVPLITSGIFVEMYPATFLFGFWVFLKKKILIWVYDTQR